jgi:hypothetical protein
MARRLENSFEEEVMNRQVQADPFAQRSDDAAKDYELEQAWFDAPRRSSRPPSMRPWPVSSPPPPPRPSSSAIEQSRIEDPVADNWFR